LHDLNHGLNKSTLFGSMSKHFHHTKLQSWSHPGGPTQKNHAFKQPLSHREDSYSKT